MLVELVPETPCYIPVSLQILRNEGQVAAVYA
jgi:hypothetical protein